MELERCAKCGLHIPENAVQQGQLIQEVWYPLHMGCAEDWLGETIPVWTITVDGCGYTEGCIENVKAHIESMDEDSSCEIEARTMKRIDYLKLPEFTGF